MCMFCAAIPAVGAMGAAATANRKAALREEQAIVRGETCPMEKHYNVPAWMMTLPTEKLTLLAIGGLLAGSVVYHQQLGG